MSDVEINVYNPYGEQETIPKTSLNQALKVGYRVPSQAEVDKHFEKQDYEDRGGQAVAAGLARGATLGLSDELLTSTGAAEPETLAKLKEYHPIKSAVSEVGGAVGGALLAPEASLPGLAAKIGVGGAGMIAPVLEAGASRIASPVVKALITKGGISAARGAIEGGLYGAGQAVTEHALGDKDLNAEKVLAHVGYGSLLGGSIGGAFGAAEATIPPAVDAAKGTLNKVSNLMFGADESGVGPLGKAYAKASSFVSGKPEETILDAIKNRANLLQTPEEKMAMAQDFSSSLDQHYKQMSKASYAARQSLKPQEIQSALHDVNPAPAQDLFLNKMTEIEDAVKQIRSEPDLYPQGYGRQLELIKDRLTKKVSSESSAFDVFNALEDAKNTIRDDIKFGKIPAPGDMRAQGLLKGISSGLKDSLENESVWGGAAATQSSYNEELNGFLHNKNIFQKTFMTKIPTRSGGVEYKINPSKVNSFFAQIDKASGAQKAEVLQGFLDSSGSYLKKIEELHAKFPVDNIRPDELRALLEKNQDVVGRTMKQAEINKTLGHLEGGTHNTYLGEGMAGMAALHSPILGAGIEAINMLRSPSIAIQRLARLNSMAERVSASIERSAKGLFKLSTDASKMSAGYIGGNLTKDKIESEHDRSSKFVKMATPLLNDPERLMDHLGKATEHVYMAAPDTAASLQQTMTRAMQYLQAANPHQPSPYPLGESPEPSVYEKNIFAERVHTIENPISILGELKSGTLVPAHIEAVATVYPKLFSEMQQSVMGALSSAIAKKQSISYQMKNMLSMFLDKDMDASIAPGAVVANQMILANSSLGSGNRDAQMNGVGKTNEKGLDHLMMSNNLRTDMQKSAERIDRS